MADSIVTLNGKYLPALLVNSITLISTPLEMQAL